MNLERRKNLMVILSSLAGIAVGLFMLVAIQGRMEKMQAPHIDFGELLWVPDWRVPHILALGDDDTAADLLWIRSVFYVGAYHKHTDHLNHDHEHHIDYTYHRGHDTAHKGEHDHLDHPVHDHKDHLHTNAHADQKSVAEGVQTDSIIDFKEFDFRNISFIRNTLKGYLDDDEALHLYHLFDVVTDLDPRFITPYHQGAMFLILMAGRWEQALKLLDKGIENRPDRWEMFFYKGFVRLFYQNDKAGAEKNIRAAAMKKDAPFFVVRFAAALQVGLGKIPMGIEFLRSLYETTGDERLKADIEKLIELYKGKL